MHDDRTLDVDALRAIPQARGAAPLDRRARPAAAAGATASPASKPTCCPHVPMPKPASNGRARAFAAGATCCMPTRCARPSPCTGPRHGTALAHCGCRPGTRWSSSAWTDRCAAACARAARRRTHVARARPFACTEARAAGGRHPALAARAPAVAVIGRWHPAGGRRCDPVGIACRMAGHARGAAALVGAGVNFAHGPKDDTSARHLPGCRLRAIGMQSLEDLVARMESGEMTPRNCWLPTSAASACTAVARPHWNRRNCACACSATRPIPTMRVRSTPAKMPDATFVSGARASRPRSTASCAIPRSRPNACTRRCATACSMAASACVRCWCMPPARPSAPTKRH